MKSPAHSPTFCPLSLGERVGSIAARIRLSRAFYPLSLGERVGVREVACYLNLDAGVAPSPLAPPPRGEGNRTSRGVGQSSISLAPPPRGQVHRTGLVCALIAVVTLSGSFAHAQPSNDPVLEARVKALSAELRCLVCQNQTVEDSTSPVARDMKDQVRSQLAAGKSEAEVKRYMTDRFGDFVLYKPPLKATTFVLWAGPFIALAFAGGLLLRRLRRTSSAATATPLNDLDRARARALLDDTPTP